LILVYLVVIISAVSLSVNLKRHLIYTQLYRAISAGILEYSKLLLVSPEFCYEYPVNLFLPPLVFRVIKSTYDSNLQGQLISLAIGKKIGFSARKCYGSYSIHMYIRDAYFSYDNCNSGYTLTDLFKHLSCFIFVPSLDKYPMLYNRFRMETEKVLKNIVDDFHKRYSGYLLSSEAIEGLRNHMNDILDEAMRKKIREDYREFVDILLTKSMTVEIGRIIFRFNRIIHTVSFNYDERQDPLSKAKEIEKRMIALINMSIFSLVKALPLNLWQLDNKNVLQLVLTPHFHYNFTDIEKTTKVKDNIDSFKYQINSNFHLNEKTDIVLNVGVSFDIKLYLVRLFINPSAVSFIIKGIFYKAFIAALSKTIYYVFSEFNDSRIDYLFYFPIAV